MALISGIKSKWFRGFFSPHKKHKRWYAHGSPLATHGKLCFRKAQTSPPEYSTVFVLSHPSRTRRPVLFQNPADSHGGIHQTGTFSASNLPNFSVRVSRISLWQNFNFLRVCAYCYSSPFFCPRINTDSEKWQECVLIPAPSTKAWFPFCSISKSVFSTGGPERVTASDKIYTFSAKGPFWTWASLNVRGKKKLNSIQEC